MTYAKGILGILAAVVLLGGTAAPTHAQRGFPQDCAVGERIMACSFPDPRHDMVIQTAPPNQRFLLAWIIPSRDRNLLLYTPMAPAWLPGSFEGQHLMTYGGQETPCPALISPQHANAGLYYYDGGSFGAYATIDGNAACVVRQ